jgi:hypothetical protein
MPLYTKELILISDIMLLEKRTDFKICPREKKVAPLAFHNAFD